MEKNGKVPHMQFVQTNFLSPEIFLLISSGVKVGHRGSGTDEQC